MTEKQQNASDTEWVFVNKNTGTEIRHPNLRGLLQELHLYHGLNIPVNADTLLIMYGRVDLTVTDEDGDIVPIVLAEHSPSRGIFFSMHVS